MYAATIRTTENNAYFGKDAGLRLISAWEVMGPCQ